MDVGQRLEQAKAQHRNRPLYNSHLRNQRQISDFAPRDLQERWFNGMKLALNEIDWATHGAVFPDAGPFLFLDIGCCPGGFSSYVLEKNPDARGVGISLPTPAGHDYLLEDDLRPRHELIWADILRYSFGGAIPSPSPGSVPLPWGLRCRQFDLVLLDGHPLRTQTHTAHAVGTRLLAAQLLIALQSVRLGGALVVKLANTRAADTQRVLCALDALSAQLVLVKPATIHATRDTFYAVARGIRPSGRAVPHAREVHLARVVETLMGRYAEYAADTQSVNKEWLWESLCSRADLLAYAQRCKELTAGVDRVQCDALEGAMQQEARRVF